MDFSLTDHLILGLGGLLVGLVRAGFGGGVGVVAAPVLAMVIPAKAALGVILPLTLTADLVSLRYYWGRWVGRHVVALLPGMVVGVALGWVLLDLVPESWFRKMLGALACGFGLLQVFRDRVLKPPEAPGRGTSLGVGVALGVASTLIHSGGVVMMLYLLPQGLSGRTFVATAWIIGVFLNLIKLVAYLDLGLIGRTSLTMDLWLLPALAAGALLGILLNRRLPEEWFHRAILIIVLILGVKLMLS